MIGIDIVQISRIEQKISSASFLNKAFTKAELEYYNKTGKRAETLAGFFAAKEAVAKALGTGFNGFNLTDIQITHNIHGAPIAQCFGRAADLLQNKKVNISISHDGDIATAIAMLS